MPTSARLKFDINDVVGPSAGDAALKDAESVLKRVVQATRAVDDRYVAGQILYLNLPANTAAREAIIALSQELRRDYDTLVVLGNGGGIRGAQAITGALLNPFHNLRASNQRDGMRIFYADSADAKTFSSLIELLDPPRTAFVVASISGEGEEALALVSVVRGLLQGQIGIEAVRQQIVAVVGEGTNPLSTIAKAEGWRTLVVPSGIPDAFTTFSAIGLLPAACAGVDLTALLAGASAMIERGFLPRLENDSPASAFAALHHAMGRPVHLLVPYADALVPAVDWFVALWSAALNKANAESPIALRMSGTSQQDAALQVMLDGASNKLVTFLTLEETWGDVAVPPVYPDVPEASALGRVTLSRLTDIEQRAATFALIARKRPNTNIILPKLDAYHLGELLMMFQMTTSIAGELYGADVAHAPAPGAQKRYVSALLGRPGSEDAAAEIASMPPRAPDLVLS